MPIGMPIPVMSMPIMSIPNQVPIQEPVMIQGPANDITLTRDTLSKLLILIQNIKNKKSCEEVVQPTCPQSNKTLEEKVSKLEKLVKEYENIILIINTWADNLPNPPVWWTKYKNDINNGTNLDPILNEIQNNGLSKNDKYLYLTTLKNILIKANKTTELQKVINELSNLKII